MIAALDRLEAPLPIPQSPPCSAVPRLAIGSRRGDHVLLIHAHPEAEARERIDLIERMIVAYYLYFASLGLDLPPPSHRIASLWFPRKADYQAYLRDEHADAFLTTRGYHHPTRGLVAAYDCRDDPQRVTAKDALIARREELDRFTSQLARLRSGARVRVSLAGIPGREIPRDQARTLAEGLRRQVERRELVLELSRREIDWGVAAHETIHQLVSASRLSPRPDAFPTWLHEGLAMQFEPIRHGRWAGLGSPSPLRLRDYRRLRTPPSLSSTIRDAGESSGYDADTYARAWGLVYYLRTDRPAVFVSLLDGLRIPGSGTGTAASRAASILVAPSRESDAIEETRWQEFMRGLAGPER